MAQQLHTTAAMKWSLLLCLLVFSCRDKTPATVLEHTDAVGALSSGSQVQDSLAEAADLADLAETPMPSPLPRLKKPTGIYRLLLSEAGEPRIEHTISFSNQNYLLQERYLNAKDSLVITEGTWAASDGFIWLYRDQVTAGRYAWKGDQLQYYDPGQNKRFAMQKLVPVTENKTFLDKKKEGIVFFGVGNEPFWNVQLESNDSLRFSLAAWKRPVKLELLETRQSNDSTFYLAANDSARLRVVLLPYFCSDGMSDFTYSYQVQADFNGHVYKGCAIVYKNR